MSARFTFHRLKDKYAVREERFEPRTALRSAPCRRIVTRSEATAGELRRQRN